MPYSQPTRSAARSLSPPSYRDQNHDPSGHSLGRPGHRRSYSSQPHLEFGSQSSSNSDISARSSSPTGNFQRRGAWAGLGALPRRHSSAIPTTTKFQIGEKNENSSSDDDDDDPKSSLKLKVQVMPSFSEGVPFPKSSIDHSPVTSGHMHITSPAHVVMTRPLAFMRTSSSPAAISPAPSPTPTGPPAVVLLSNGKPLRSSLKGSRVSSLLNSPMGSATPSPRTSPVNSMTNSVETSPVTSPRIPGVTAPFLNGTSLDPTTFLVPPALSGHVRAHSVPYLPPTHEVDVYPSPAATPLGPLSPSITSALATDMPLSPDMSEPPMSYEALLSPRNVHFPSLPSDLERVRVFRKEARPSSLSVTRKEHAQLASKGDARGNDGKNVPEETDTETETDRDQGYTNGYLGTWGGRGLWGAVATSPATKNQADANASFPFPRLPQLGRARSAGHKLEADNDEGSSSESGSAAGNYSRIRKTGTGPRFVKGTQEHVESADTARGCKVELDMPSSEYPVPRPESVRDALAGSTNIFLDQLHLEPSDGKKPLVLEGSFLVRNVTFEKQVYARFTTDNWGTVNEVRGKWTGSCGRSYLTSLVSASSLGVPRTLGDIIAFPGYVDTAHENTSEWDRFAFEISLPPAIGPGRVVEFVGRFSAGVAGGEWWDNCGGKNWRVGFKKVENVQVPPVPLKITEALSEPISVDIPVTATSASRDDATITNSIVPAEYEVNLQSALAKEGSSSQTLQHTKIRKGSDRQEALSPHSETKTEEFKERAPKPTGLGSFNGLGALFWPKKSPSPPLVEMKPAFSSLSSAWSDSSDTSQDSLSSSPRPSAITTPTLAAPGSPSGPSSPKMSPIVVGESPRNLPASATVEVISVVPPVAITPDRQSLDVKVPFSPPRPSTASIPEHEHGLLSSVSSSSSISSFASTDSMELPLLERSSSLSSMSTDGDDIDLIKLLHGRASGANPFSTRRLGSELDLTPMPDDSHPGTVEGGGGFFDRSGPGTGGGGIVGPSFATGSGKGLDADPLYKAFIQQWCFAGSPGSPVQGKVKSSPPHRSGLQVR